MHKENELYILIGDGVKQSKRGRRILCVKKLFQESENSAKSDFFGYHSIAQFIYVETKNPNTACPSVKYRVEVSGLAG